MKVELGMMAINMVTGHKGVVVARTEYLHDETVAAIRVKNAATGLPVLEWFGESEAKITLRSKIKKALRGAKNPAPAPAPAAPAPKKRKPRAKKAPVALPKVETPVPVPKVRKPRSKPAPADTTAIEPVI